MMSDPITCLKCGRLEEKEKWLEACPACGSAKLHFPEPSDEELIATFTPADETLPEPLFDGKETRDGRGSLLYPGDEVMLYDRIHARIFQIRMPQGWLIVRLTMPDPTGVSSVIPVLDEHYKISAAFVFAVTPRVEPPIVVKRVNLDAPVSRFKRFWTRLLNRWRGL